MEDRRENWLKAGRAVVEREGACVAALKTQLDARFVEAVGRIQNCKGHVMVCGAGMSQSVAKRLAHLLTCVGTPAVALDAGEVAHGGAGAVTANDVLISISKHTIGSKSRHHLDAFAETQYRWYSSGQCRLCSLHSSASPATCYRRARERAPWPEFLGST